MKVTQMQVSRGRTLHLGNYESARIDISMTATVDDEEDPIEVYHRLLGTVKERLKLEVGDILIGED